MNEQNVVLKWLKNAHIMTEHKSEIQANESRHLEYVSMVYTLNLSFNYV